MRVYVGFFLSPWDRGDRGDRGFGVPVRKRSSLLALYGRRRFHFAALLRTITRRQGADLERRRARRRILQLGLGRRCSLVRSRARRLGAFGTSAWYSFGLGVPCGTRGVPLAAFHTA